MSSVIVPAVSRELSRRDGSISAHEQPRMLRCSPSTQLPTIALLVLTVVVGSVAIAASHRGRIDQLALSGLTEDTTLLHSRVDAIPLGARWSGIMRTTLAPGAVWTLGQQGYEDVGPQLYRVETGSLTVQAESPISIVRAGATQPQAVSSNTAVVLHVGDQGFTATGVLSQWRNEGLEPVSVLFVEIAVVGYDTHTILPVGVTRTPLIEQRTMTEPNDPMIVTVRQVTLPSRATLPLDAVPGLQLLYIVSGQLAAHDPPDTSDPVNPLMLSQELTGHRLSKGTAAMGTFRRDRVISNPATESTTLLLMTITAAEAAAGTPP